MNTETELPLVDVVDTAIKEGMCTKNPVMLNTYRKVKTLYTEALKSGAKEGNSTMVAAIEKAAKDHKSSIEEYTKADRMDLVAEEKASLIILEPFLPKMMSEDEIRTEVETLMIDNNIVDQKDRGRLMGMLSKNKSIDMKVASGIVAKAFR